MAETKVILSLFDYTGNWSAPYASAGYDVCRMDIKQGQDVRLARLDQLPKHVHGILAAPPCTHFASSGARWWAGKGDEALLEGLARIDAVMRLVVVLKPKWWVLENPVGRLVHYIGPPRMWFNPCDYGDPYTKKTGLWGEFNTNLPHTPVPPTQGSRIHSMSSSWKEQRSATPQGFAKAFFVANP